MRPVPGGAQHDCRGKPSGMVKPWRPKGQCPRSRPVLPAPQLTRTLLPQGPASHLSEPLVNRLADQGAALGFGCETANLPSGVRFSNNSLWGRVRMGEI